MAQMTGGEALVAALAAEGVDTIFGIPGTHNLDIYDALYAQSAIRHITTRHEQGAAYMADGYARASGKVGVCLTVTGPGGTNALSALGQAYSDSSPVLLVQSQVDLPLVDREQEGFHELRQSLSVYQAVTTWNARAESVRGVPRAVREAFARMRGGRPRPVQLEIPRDILAAKDDVEITPSGQPERDAAPEAQVAKTARLLADARRPLIYAGGGAIAASAGQEMRALADLLGAPVATTIQGKGVIPDDHPMCVGDGWRNHIAGQEALAMADVVLAVGTRFSQLCTNGQTLKLGETLIHLDLDPSEIGKHYPAEVGLVGDARRVLEQILSVLQSLGARAPANSWCDVAATRQARMRAAEPPGGAALRVLESLRAVLPREAIVCNDLNAVSYWAGLGFPVYEPRTFFYPSGFGCLGFALPAAIGAKVAHPERPVVALAGDGGCLFTCQELATAVQQGLAVVLIVFNDAAYGALKADQAHHFGRRMIAADLSRVDFAMLARSFGARGLAIPSLDDLGDAVAGALQSPGPVVIEAPSPAVTPPWLA